MKQKVKLAVIGSGSGTNFQSIADSVEKGILPVEIVCVLSDVENAYILERARKIGIPAEYVSAAPFKTKLDGEGEQRFIEKLSYYGAELVALAGFMRIVKKRFLSAFPLGVLNIHPALLPSFPGLEAWKQALEHGVKISGCTVHFVDEGTDTGPIIIQRAVPVLEDDTPSSLHARIQEQEHVAYPEAIRLVAEGRVKIQGRRAIILPLHSK